MLVCPTPVYSDRVVYFRGYTVLERRIAGDLTCVWVRRPYSQVHKVAGAAAETGLPLDSVHAEAMSAADSVGTLGVALTTCTLPGQPVSDRLSGSKIEIGLGIHGESGSEHAPRGLCRPSIASCYREAFTCGVHVPVHMPASLSHCELVRSFQYLYRATCAKCPPIVETHSGVPLSLFSRRT